MQNTVIQNVPALEPLALRGLEAQPLVSILLANYNYANYVGQTIESVLGQSYGHWELVICDDGSTDNSVTIIQSYADKDRRITFVRQPNGGHTAALNTAYSLCQGEIICFLDSDDLFLPGKVESVVQACLQNADAGLIIHRVIRVDEQRRRKGVWPMSDLPDGWLGPDVVKSGGILAFAPPTSGISLRRELAELIFPISKKPPLDMCPDQVVMRVAPLVSAVKRLPGALAEFRMHGSNSYSKQGVSVQAVAKQLQISTALWQEQARFLEEFEPGLSAHLAPLDNSTLTALLRYLEAKLNRARTVGTEHQNFIATCRRLGDTKWLAFWRISIYLPNFIFRPAVQLLTGQSAIKQFFARFRQLA
jgi:hypothetical protein